MWDESKHPRDKDGKFTNGSNLAKELKPNAEIEKAKGESIEGLRERLKRVLKPTKQANESDKNNGENADAPEHNPDKNYVYQPGKIAGAEKGSPMSFEEADGGRVNPYYKKGIKGYNKNCQTCVATYFARRLGYDVRALPNVNNPSITMLSHNTALAYIDADGKHPQYYSPRLGESDIDFLERTVKTNEIHSLEFHSPIKRSGHIVVVERNKNGELYIYDPQTDRVVDRMELPTYLRAKIMIKTLNLSKCTIDEQFADNIMKSYNRS